MRLSLLKTILLVVIFQLLFALTGKGQSISTEKVTLGLKDESLDTAIKRIEKQSVFRFFYRNEDIMPMDHLNLIPGSRTIEQTLTILLQNTDLVFKQLDRNILLEHKPPPPPVSYQINGRVLDSTDQKPVANASVFLSNSTVGAITDENGGFKLIIAKGGKYELIVSILGYQPYQKVLFIDKDNITLPAIGITPKPITLTEVKVKNTAVADKTDPNRERNYRWFKEEFLGYSNFADKCKILNPEILTLNYDENSRTLTASSSDLLEIVNDALGYKLKYLLTQFSSDKNSGLVTYKGSVFFESIESAPSDQLKRKKNRLKAYKGSIMHFLRSVLENQLDAEGFKVLDLKRKPLPEFPYKYIDSLGQNPLQVNDFVKLSNKKGIYALNFKDCLYIMYTKLHNYTGNLADIPPAAQRDYAKTTVTITAPYIFFDDNGIILNPESIVKEGYWAKSRVAELLPSDYSMDN